MTGESHNIEDLPAHIQDAIKRRESQTRPIHSAIEALDLTWEITGGNMAELERALQVFEGDRWKEVHDHGPATHGYHRHVLRLFHNFLAASVSTVWHAERIVGRIKNIAPELSDEFSRRIIKLQASPDFCFLDRLRDYAIHAGHHITVLVFQGVTSEQDDMILVRSVCFDVKQVRIDIEQELRRTRSKATRDDIAGLRALLAALPEQVEMRGLVQGYFAQVGDLLKWLRKALIDFNSALSARPFESWIAKDPVNEVPRADDIDDSPAQQQSDD